MEKVSSLSELDRYLRKIEAVFDPKSFVNQDVDSEYIIDYYQQSDTGYRVFHSTEGSVHMALNYDGVFNKNGYYEQARFVKKQIDEIDARKILELASGKGFNGIFLAQQDPSLDLWGIDLTPAHVEQAKEYSKSIENLHFSIGDFQSLEFTDSSFDLIFEVESICHATDMQLALSEANRVLRTGGRFVAFDGFRNSGFDELDQRLQFASKLVEVSMAVGHGWVIDDWLQVAQDVGFRLVEVEDISEAIMPNLKRFQVLARGFFKYSSLGKSVLRILPPHLVQNAIAGLLMPFTIEANAQGYYRIVLEK